MRVYSLTALGRRMSSSTRGGDTPSWRVVYHLRGTVRATRDELTELGASPSDLARLKRPPALIKEDEL